MGEVVALLGPNGSGKTTPTAKLAPRFQAQGKAAILGANSGLLNYIFGKNRQELIYSYLNLGVLKRASLDD